MKWRTTEASRRKGGAGPGMRVTSGKLAGCGGTGSERPGCGINHHSHHRRETRH